MSLAVQTRQIILRSSDGNGDNHSKSFNIQWNRILTTSFTQWRVRCRFVSLTGEFNGVSSEVRWSISANNQVDTGGTGQTLCFPVIRQDINLDGTLAGSFMMTDFDESLVLSVSTPTSPVLTISVYGMDEQLVSNMTGWVLCLIFEPTTARR